MRAQCEIRPLSNGKEEIVVTEIPYQVNKSRMISGIADLVKDKKIEVLLILRTIQTEMVLILLLSVKRTTVLRLYLISFISTHSYRKLTA